MKERTGLYVHNLSSGMPEAAMVVEDVYEKRGIISKRLVVMKADGKFKRAYLRETLCSF